MCIKKLVVFLGTMMLGTCTVCGCVSKVNGSLAAENETPAIAGHWVGEDLIPDSYITNCANEDHNEDFDYMIFEYDEPAETDKEYRNLLTYEEYVEYCLNNGLEQKYSDENKKYYVIEKRTIHGCEHCFICCEDINEDEVKLYTDTRGTRETYGYCIFLPLDENVVNVSVTEFIKWDLNNAFVQRDLNSPIDGAHYRPVIYMEPEGEEIKVKVKFVKIQHLMQNNE